MPVIQVRNECKTPETFRVQQVASLFDVPLAKKCSVEFSVEVPSADEDWQIGAIVGPSGSGKSSVARAAFGSQLYAGGPWRRGRSVVDCFPEHLSIRDITEALTAVGFSSPPAWARPYEVLSNGEKFRCDLAYALLVPPGRPERGALVAFDEFTSVVDRTVARVGSAAAAKFIRRRNRETRSRGRGIVRFVAVTCHYDVVRWLQPDWVLDMATGKLARGRLQCRRPQIRLEIFRCRHEAWSLFSRHHYLSAQLNVHAKCYLGTWDGQPVAFTAVLPLAGHHGVWRESRTVVLPDYQGVGIGSRQAEAVAELFVRQGSRYTSSTSHPAVISHRQRSPLWKVTAVMKDGGNPQGGTQKHITTSRGRSVVSFEYLGRH